MGARATWAVGAVQRAAPVIVFLIGAAVIWLPPRPPMVDLPQFGGEIGLLNGLVTGVSPWAARLRIDALTPYLLGYAVTLPLALVLPVAAALKVVLTAALAAFGLLAAAIRRELGATRTLDAYALIGLFGVNYTWGLFTFLVAAPLALLVIWLSLRYARAPDGRRSVALLAAGGALLFAHGLVFLFAVALGALLVIISAGGVRSAAGRVWPFVILALSAALIFGRAGRGSTGGPEPAFEFGPIGLRLIGPLFSIDGRPNGWTVALLAILAAFPFLAGLKFTIRPAGRAVIFGAVFGVVALAPVIVWVAGLLNLRFTLFLPTAWAWMFSDRPSPPEDADPWGQARTTLVACVLTGTVLAQHLVRAAAFARETADFDAVMAAARPGQTALGLVLDEASAADVDPHIYRDFTSWYQADKGGLVDPSFAASPPSIVRYRRNPPAPSLYPPTDFDWRRDQGGQWTYFFVRDRGPFPGTLFAGAPCPPAMIARRGAWTLFEARACEVTSNPIGPLRGRR